MEYKLTTGMTGSKWWARLENETHYARAEGASEWDAVYNATHEAMGIIGYRAVVVRKPVSKVLTNREP